MIRSYRIGSRKVAVEVEPQAAYILPPEKHLDIAIQPVMSREERRGADALTDGELVNHLVNCLGFIGNGGRMKLVSLTVMGGM